MWQSQGHLADMHMQVILDSLFPCIKRGNDWTSLYLDIDQINSIHIGNTKLNWTLMYLFLVRIASHVLLSTITVPIPVSLSNTEKYLELDESAREKSRRLAALLGLQTIPTRDSLIQEMVCIGWMMAIVTMLMMKTLLLKLWYF